MKAISLHRDVLVVTSQLLQVNCTIVRAAGAAGGSAGEGALGEQARAGEGRGDEGRGGEHPASEHPAREECFVIDSPVLPEELDLLASLLQQAGFPAPRGLLVTHADWDHVLAPLAFPQAALGCAESSAERLQAEPGAAQRALRDFDEELYLVRRPLSLSSVQALAVPGRCEIGGAELELHPTEGHTADGMALWVPWARVLIAGDYVSAVELPALNDGERIDAYLATLERLRPLVALAEHVVPGHGPVLDSRQALEVLEQDTVYLQALREQAGEAELPVGRRSKAQRELHAENVKQLD